jgi:16S rRNA (guanine966-N2)-methyltransferase
MRIAAGRFKGRRLPRPRSARPVSGRLKTSLFSVLAPRLDGARVLDLCAGVGGLGLEALSRGAASVLLLERDGATARDLAAWIREAGAEGQAEARRRDVLRGPLPSGPFDLIFFDPPFPFWKGGQVTSSLAAAFERLAPDGRVVLKLPAKMDVPADPRWAVERHVRVASTAYALLQRAGG